VRRSAFRPISTKRSKRSRNRKKCPWPGLCVKEHRQRPRDRRTAPDLAPPSSLDLASPAFSLFAFAELRDLLEKLDACRVVLPATDGEELGLDRVGADRAFRNRLQLRWLARECAAWIRRRPSCALLRALLPQSILIGGKPIQSFIVSSLGTVLSQRKGWGSLPAINSA
jgi:hypothetical protein